MITTNDNTNVDNNDIIHTTTTVDYVEITSKILNFVVSFVDDDEGCNEDVRREDADDLESRPGSAKRVRVIEFP